MRRGIGKISFTIRQRLNLFLLFAFGIIFVVGLLINYWSMQIIQHQVVEFHTLSLEEFQDDFEENMERMSRLASRLAVDGDIITLNLRPETVQKEYIWDYKDLLNQLTLLDQINDIEADINVILPEKKRIFSSVNGLREIENTEAFLRNMEDASVGLWEIREQNVYLPVDKSLSFIQSGNGLADGSSVMVEVDISEKAIRQMLGEFQSQEKGMPFCIYGMSDLIFYENVYSLDQTELIETLEEMTQEKGETTVYQEGKRYRLLFCTSDRADMVLGYIFEESQYLQPVLIARRFLFVFAILVILLGFGLTSSIYRMLLSPLEQLIHAMLEVKNNNLKVRVSDSRLPEMKFVYEQFNSMVERLDYTINEIYRKNLLLEKNRLKLLQSQINPHFLYNSLNFVYRMILSENLEGASKMVLFLGKYFRYATKNNIDVTTVGEEIENICAYLYIQQMRYPDKITFEIGDAEEIKTCKIPRLLIQPVVENIFVHGISSYEDRIKVELTFMRREDGQIRVEVCNNGEQLDADRLREINEKIRTETDGHGLNNVYQRLHLFWGEKSSLWMESRENRTAVVMMFPSGYEEIRIGEENV